MARTVLLLSLLAACSATPAVRPDAGLPEDPRGPRFLTFSSNSTELLDGQPLTVTAVLTDPDGVDDLIGGTLLDPATGASYGAFETSASEGSYQLTLTWPQLDAVSPIDGSLGDPMHRTLRAQFFDTAGHQTSRDLEIGLGCASASGIACSTGCADAYGTNSCGACGNRCTDRCMAGNTAVACGDQIQRDQLGSCAAGCQAVNMVCGDDHGSFGTATYGLGASELTLTSCNDVPPSMNGNDPFVWMTCVCLDP
jgi:hypothetical protein